MVPVSAAWITRFIIDEVTAIVHGRAAPSAHLYGLVASEFGLMVAANVFSRLIDYYEAVLADRYARQVSIDVMNHASKLDLQAYEDPVFYDRLERARIQATDRPTMFQSFGRLFQQAITALSLSAAILYFSPWLLVLLIASMIPAFLGETHFAFLVYAKNYRQAPVKRHLDYLRQLGGSRESAKELRLFGLRSFVTDCFTRFSDSILEENLAFYKRRLRGVSLLSMFSTAAYYGPYFWAIYQTVRGVFTLGTLVFLTQSIMNASANMSQFFSTLAILADQASSSLIYSPSLKSNPRLRRGRTPYRRPVRFSRALNLETFRLSIQGQNARSYTASTFGLHLANGLLSLATTVKVRQRL